MCYEGCEIKYKVSISDKIFIEHIDPKESNSNWPYPDYPVYLPYFSLDVDKSHAVSKELFLERVIYTKSELNNEELILVVPTNPHLGISMWGPSGDAEGLELIFIFNTKTGLIEANCVCS